MNTVRIDGARPRGFNYSASRGFDRLVGDFNARTYVPRINRCRDELSPPAHVPRGVHKSLSFERFLCMQRNGHAMDLSVGREGQLIPASRRGGETV